MGSHLEELTVSELKRLCTILDLQPDKSKNAMLKNICALDAEKLTVAQFKDVFELVAMAKSGLKKDLINRFNEFRQTRQPLPSVGAKKPVISKALRDSVFSTYNENSYDNAYCYTGCGEKITPFNFECGHVIAFSQGGQTNLDNLRPICARCNQSMGTKNMEVFIKDCGFTKINKCRCGKPANKGFKMCQKCFIESKSSVAKKEVIPSALDVNVGLQQLQIQMQQLQLQQLQAQITNTPRPQQGAVSTAMETAVPLLCPNASLLL